MRILLIFPPSKEHYKGTKFEGLIETQVPLGLTTIAGSLEKEGHQVKILDLEIEKDFRSILIKTINEFKPEICGITIKTPFFKIVKLISNLIKGLDKKMIIIAGGVHPTIYPKETLENSDIDICVMGEGDETSVEIASGKGYENINGIAFKKDGKIIINERRAYIQDLDKLPFPSWHLLDLSKYTGISPLIHKKNPVGFIETSRGCLANCIFCSKSIFGRTFRVKSPKRVVDEIEYMIGCGFKEICIVDDNFTTQINRAISILDEIIKRKLNIPINCINGVRVNSVNEEFFKKAKEAGVHLVAFGYESGSQEILNKIRKGITIEQGIKATKLARKYGMKIVGYFMIGLPYETEEDIKKTIEFACSLDIDYVKFDFTIPLPGTELYSIWDKKINKEELLNFNYHLIPKEIYTHPNLDWNSLERLGKEAYRKFYFRPSYITKQLIRRIKDGRLLDLIKASLSINRY